MATTAIGNGFTPEIPSWLAGTFAWAAGGLLIWQVSRAQLLQISFLLLLSSAVFGTALALGDHPSWLRLLDSTTGLLAMLAAVSFLRLVAMGGSTGEESPPQGMIAFRQTMLVVALFGSFINISAAVLVADRLSRTRPLSPFAAQSIIRVFTGGAAWSPFFAGMAVVLTYIAEARLLSVMVVGLPFAAIGLLLVLAEAHWRYRPELAGFEGYPVTFASLWVPLSLTFAVVSGHAALPKVPILAIIALSAVAVSVFFLTFRHGPSGACRYLLDHILHGLPGMVGELLLFLSAGMLVVGLQALVAAEHFQLPAIANFTAINAALLLAAMVAASAVGVHPIISIALATPLLTPSEPAPLLLAMCYVFAWSLGTCAGPLSGINLTMQGRYGIESFRGATRNWPYVAAMYGVGVVLLFLVDRLAG